MFLELIDNLNMKNNTLVYARNYKSNNKLVLFTIASIIVFCFLR